MEVEYTPEFRRNLRALSKKYRSAKKDIEPVVQKIQSGETVGDRIPRVGYVLYKARVRNSDVQKGKSGGYRLIYYIKTSDSVILVTIYSKSDQSDISSKDLQHILAEFKRR